MHSAGTDPGPGLNALSVQVLDEVGADIRGEAPQPIDPLLLGSVDPVVTLGREAHVEVPDGVTIRNWDTRALQPWRGRHRAHATGPR